MKPPFFLIAILFFAACGTAKPMGVANLLPRADVACFTYSDRPLSADVSKKLLEMLRQHEATLKEKVKDVRMIASPNGFGDVMMKLAPLRYFGFMHEGRKVAVQLFVFDTDNAIVQLTIPGPGDSEQFFASIEPALIRDLTSVEGLKY